MKRWKRLGYGLNLEKKQYSDRLSILLAISIIILVLGIFNRVYTLIFEDKDPIVEKIAKAHSINETYEKIFRVRGSGHYYEIKTSESGENYFIISSIVTPCFDYNLFVENMIKGMPITLTVLNERTLSGNIPVYAVSSDEFVFLSIDNTIRAYNSSDNCSEYMGWLFVFIGLVSLSIIWLMIHLRLLR